MIWKPSGMILRSLIRPLLQNSLAWIPQAGGPPCIPILMYHSIDDSGSRISVSAKSFADQMDHFAALGWRTIALSDLGRWLSGESPQPPPRTFVVTFDDGYDSVATEAWPILRRHGFSATTFLAGEYMDRQSAWCDDPTISRLRIMSWETARRLAGEGMEFGCHSASHCFLTLCTDSALAREVIEARRMLRERLDCPVETFCYPYGDFDPRIERFVADAGYLAATTIFPGNRSRPSQRLSLPRVCGVGYEPLSYYRLATRPGFQVYTAIKKETAALHAQIALQKSAAGGGSGLRS